MPRFSEGVPLAMPVRTGTSPDRLNRGHAGEWKKTGWPHIFILHPRAVILCKKWQEAVAERILRARSGPGFRATGRQARRSLQGNSADSAPPLAGIQFVAQLGGGTGALQPGGFMYTLDRIVCTPGVVSGKRASRVRVDCRCGSWPACRGPHRRGSSPGFPIHTT